MIKICRFQNEKVKPKGKYKQRTIKCCNCMYKETNRCKIEQEKYKEMLKEEERKIFGMK